MNYEDSIKWLYSFEKFGIKLELDRIKYICKKLKNPQNRYKIIHVGGTNGKGSVCRYLHSILSLNGYKTGLYTSPHLTDFSERFVINDKEISKEEIISLVKKIKPIIDEMQEEENIPTYFEILTAMAFLYFFEKDVEIAIIEVGLGGRFDATNIVNPVVSVITNISIEHQDRLGKDIEDIAFEKAGIIKKNTPLVTAAVDDSLKVIKKIADEKNSSIIIANKNSWKRLKGGFDWQNFLIKGSLKEYNINISSPGLFQGENIALSVNTIEVLQMNGTYITDESIIKGFEITKNPGRMEIVSYEPLILLDGAHNIAGIVNLKNILENDFIFEKLILVIGILSDKNVKEMLEIISAIADIIILTKSKNIRAEKPSKLKEIIKGDAIIKEDISDAIEYAKNVANKKDLICITGSLFTVGEAKIYLKKFL